MRPTGPLHLGHLVGALDSWRRLQDEYDCFYMIADWHALMSEYADTEGLASFSLECLADWIAAGIDPEKSTLFLQSRVSEHLELFMILSNITPLGWLERCPTYKEQLREVTGRDLTNYAFLGYPVLQAADILLYRAECVPVGEDQVAHLELTRELVRRFESFYGPIFPEPQPLLSVTKRLLGLDNRKMSKSLDNFIGLGERPESIRKKVLSMVTDPERIKLEDPGHPDRCTVFSYFGAFQEEMTGGVRSWCEGATVGCVACKKKLAEAVIAFLEPIRKKRNELLHDKEELETILRQGTAKAREAAAQTMREVKKYVKLLT